MANAANAPFVRHPPLLALFAPRPPPPFKPPMTSKSIPKISGVAAYTQQFAKYEEEEAREEEQRAAAAAKESEESKQPVRVFETMTERLERKKREKEEKHLKLLAEREKSWDPHNNANATKDPYKTLFVARLSYDLAEDDLRKEFEQFGRIRHVRLICDSNSGKSRGYAFIEFERSADLKEAYQHADGIKLNQRRILVDVERGRTVKTWKPRKLGGGLGKTRAVPVSSEPVNPLSSSSSAMQGSSRHGSRPQTHNARDGGRRDRGRGGGGGGGVDHRHTMHAMADAETEDEEEEEEEEIGMVHDETSIAQRETENIVIEIANTIMIEESGEWVDLIAIRETEEEEENVSGIEDGEEIALKT
eukprot:CAMPEP_0202727328 /NCGR_PEP_ID=MMETSP1385-20130828/185065_1 /ASSEMBLY_ACC=CAM_ASM_000861 /TAXON_ID=933848 /ORGANISM="Elphidium margaritaceum" /LENGTH=360 /DNA_ID=CAMNT_0049393567 /DNA_START=53 /DNA_END=1135 /DNA_ORIENTATION=-